MSVKQLIPNVLTLARFPLGVVFVLCYLAGHPWIGLVALIAAFISDFLDGRLARRWNVSSAFGTAWDPYGDKWICWIITLLLLVELSPLTPFWPIVAAQFAYDAGISAIRYIFGRRNIPTNIFAKLKTTYLMVSLALFYVTLFSPIPITSAIYVLASILGYISIWYGLRSAAGYIRGYGWGNLIPRPLHNIL